MVPPLVAWRLGMAGLAIIAAARGVRTILDHPYVTPALLAIADDYAPASIIIGAAWLATAAGLTANIIHARSRLCRVSLLTFVFLASSMALAYLLSLPLQGPDIDLWIWASIHLGTTLVAMHLTIAKRV